MKAPVADLKADVARVTADLIALRRDLHQHPELAFREERTAGLLAGRLRGLGLDVKTGVGKTGVVGVLTGRPGRKTVAIRADMDALPLTEETSAPYRSAVTGAMHACGHDGHTAAALTAAHILAQRRDAFTGSIKFLFQPAEETANGAEAMIRDGAMDNPKVDAVLSAHLWNYLPVGTIGVRPGPMWASADDIRITIKGKGGHGALPHQTIDPIPIAAHVVLALQNLVTREITPFQPVVLTFGAMQGGSAFNVIPSTVSLAGTLRAYDMALRDRLVQRAEEIVRGVCQAMRAGYDFEARFCCPPVVNDPGVTEVVRTVAQRIVGPGRVVTVDQNTVGDDVAYFISRAPGCHFLVGSGNPERGLDTPHHHPKFDFDEAALPIAVEVLASAALELLSRD